MNETNVLSLRGQHLMQIPESIRGQGPLTELDLNLNQLVDTAHMDRRAIPANNVEPLPQPTRLCTRLSLATDRSARLKPGRQPFRLTLRKARQSGQFAHARSWA